LACCHYRCCCRCAAVSLGCRQVLPASSTHGSAGAPQTAGNWHQQHMTAGIIPNAAEHRHCHAMQGSTVNTARPAVSRKVYCVPFYNHKGSVSKSVPASSPAVQLNSPSAVLPTGMLPLQHSRRQLWLSASSSRHHAWHSFQQQMLQERIGSEDADSCSCYSSSSGALPGRSFYRIQCWVKTGH
jgi:hypothetical protein